MKVESAASLTDCNYAAITALVVNLVKFRAQLQSIWPYLLTTYYPVGGLGRRQEFSKHLGPEPTPPAVPKCGPSSLASASKSRRQVFRARPLFLFPRGFHLSDRPVAFEARFFTESMAHPSPTPFGVWSVATVLCCRWCQGKRMWRSRRQTGVHVSAPQSWTDFTFLKILSFVVMARYHDKTKVLPAENIFFPSVEIQTS